MEASSDSWKPRLTGASMTTSPHAKIAFVYSDNPFSKAVVVAAREQAKESGFAIVLDESYAPGDHRFQPDHQHAGISDRIRGPRPRRGTRGR